MAEQFESAHSLVFVLTLLALGLCEQWRAWQRTPTPVHGRWFANAGLFLINGTLTRMVLPLGIVLFASDQTRGLLPPLGIAPVALFLLTFVLLDFCNYWQHRWLHEVPILWRAHVVHHSDSHVDVTTSQRHHPAESLLGTAILCALVAVLGLPAEALAVYLVVAGALAIFSHANLKLAPRTERWLSTVVPSPGFHALHHSALRAQTNSNYALVLTIWDRLFGTYLDPNQHPVARHGLEYFDQPRDVHLSRVLLQPFLRQQAEPGRPEVPIAPSRVPAAPVIAVAQLPAGLTERWRTTLLGATMGTALLLLAMAPTAVALARSWQAQEAYRYAWLVVPVLVYMLAGPFRQETLAQVPRPGMAGLCLAGSAAVLWAIASAINIDVARQLALVLALHGVVMAALGWRLYGRLFPVLALTFLMVPSGDVLQPILRALTMRSIEAFAWLAGMPHTVDGFLITIGGQRYFVLDACSGLPQVTLMIFLSYCFGLLLFRSPFKIATLTLLGAALGVISNVVRVNTIVLIDWIQGTQMDLTDHGTIQWIVLAGILGLLLFLLARLKPDPVPMFDIADALPPPTTLLRAAPAWAGLLAVVLAGGLFWIPELAPGPRATAASVSLADDVAGWTRAPSSPRSSVDADSATHTLSADYQKAGRTLRVTVNVTLAPNAKVAESAREPDPRGTWRDLHVTRETGCNKADCMDLLHTTWERRKNQPLRHVYHGYGTSDLHTVSRLELRAHQGWQRIVRGDTRTWLIALSFEGDPPDAADVAALYRMVSQTMLRQAG